jgi:hypothetical protein
LSVAAAIIAVGLMLIIDQGSKEEDKDPVHEPHNYPEQKQAAKNLHDGQMAQVS